MRRRHRGWVHYGFSRVDTPPVGVPGWQTAWGSNGSFHRGRDGHPDSRRVYEGDIYPSKRARERWREKLPGSVPLRPWTDPFPSERSVLKWSTLSVAERLIINGIARSRLVSLYTIGASSA